MVLLRSVFPVYYFSHRPKVQWVEGFVTAEVWCTGSAGVVQCVGDSVQLRGLPFADLGLCSGAYSAQMVRVSGKAGLMHLAVMNDHQSLIWYDDHTVVKPLVVSSWMLESGDIPGEWTSLGWWRVC